MWKTNKGPCTCYFCSAQKVHPKPHKIHMTQERGHLQVAESLDPKDIVHTIMCTICTHEIMREDDAQEYTTP